MKNILSFPGRDKGSITVLALLVLVILTLIGIGVLTTASSDMEAARNMDIYRRNFARAEAAVRDGMQQLKAIEDTSNWAALRNIASHSIVWLNRALPNDSDINDAANWVAGGTASASIDNECLYTVREIKGPVGSLVKGSDAEYAVFGRSNQNRGEVIIRVGYRIHVPPPT